MNLTIHRGTHEIGGSCIELNTANTRIFLDYGLPLVDREGEQLSLPRWNKPSYQSLIESQIAPNIPYFANRDDKPTYLLLSHSHQDHFGLLVYLPSDIPIYCSKGTKILLEVANYFGQSTFNPSKVNTIEPWEKISVGDFTITPYLADHSAIDAFSFLIEIDNVRIFYSGDIRSHGRKEILFKNLILKPPEKIDYLILEGTSLGRDSSLIETEKDIEDRLAQELSNPGLYIASFSSQNIDRFVSFFKACRSTHRTLVVDPYTASILNALKVLSPHLPQYDWDNSFKVYFVDNSYTQKMAKDFSLDKYRSAEISLTEIVNQQSRLVVKENYKISHVLKNEGLLVNTKLLYSMWDGYLKADNFWQTNNVPIIKIHTSGHAYKQDLIRLVEAINPVKVIPNHTFYPDEFKELFGSKSIVLKDGEILEC